MNLMAVYEKDCYQVTPECQGQLRHSSPGKRWKHPELPCGIGLEDICKVRLLWGQEEEDNTLKHSNWVTGIMDVSLIQVTIPGLFFGFWIISVFWEIRNAKF